MILKRVGRLLSEQFWIGSFFAYIYRREKTTKENLKIQKIWYFSIIMSQNPGLKHIVLQLLRTEE